MIPQTTTANYYHIYEDFIDSVMVCNSTFEQWWWVGLFWWEPGTFSKFGLCLTTIGKYIPRFLLHYHTHFIFFHQYFFLLLKPAQSIIFIKGQKSVLSTDLEKNSDLFSRLFPVNLYCVYQFSHAYQFRQTMSCEPTFRVECLLHGDCKINSVKTDIVLIFVMKENIEGAVKN